MLGAPITLYLYIGMTVLAGGFFGHFLIRRGRKRATLMLVLGHVFAAVALYLAAQQAQPPAAAVPYLLFLFLMVLPSLVGVSLGAALGWWRGPAPKLE